MAGTRLRFEHEIADVSLRVLEMGAAAEEIVRDSIVALTTQNASLAATIMPRDDEIDRLDIEIEAMCLRLLVREQPVAADLRLIGTALKIITDIERIGDHGVDIARVAQRLSGDLVYKPLVDIPRMGDLARAMLHDSLEAFVHRDLDLVHRVIAADDAVDDLYARMKTDLHAVMQRDSNSVLQASHLLFVAHYIERIADHCCNIAERVGFLQTGRTPIYPAGAKPSVLPAPISSHAS
jgi:phosphate transport system protein